MRRDRWRWLRENIRDCLKSFFIYITFSTFVLEVGVVPSGSMRCTLVEGDVLLFDKITCGPGTPSSIHIPYTKDKIGPFPSYIGFFPRLRFPRLRNYKRNDIVIFPEPSFLSRPGTPPNARDQLVKRMVAMYGESIYIHKGIFYIDKKVVPFPPYAERVFNVKSVPSLPLERFFKKSGWKYKKVIGSPCCYKIYLLEIEKKKSLQKLRKLSSSIRVQPSIMKKKYIEDDEDLLVGALKGNLDFMAEVVVPKKGMKIKLTPHLLQVYKQLFLYHENIKNVNIKYGKNGAELWINDVLQTDYTFNYDYFLPMGDNRNGSCDGRSFSFVPIHEIRGILLCRIWSLPIHSQMPVINFFIGFVRGDIRWKRFFQKVE